MSCTLRLLGPWPAALSPCNASGCVFVRRLGSGDEHSPVPPFVSRALQSNSKTRLFLYPRPGPFPVRNGRRPPISHDVTSIVVRNIEAQA
jgi:hypothetical protein